MPNKAHTEEQIVAVLWQVQAGAGVDEVCRRLGDQPGHLLSVETKIYGSRSERVALAAAVAGRGGTAEAAGGGPELGSADAAGDRLEKAVRLRARRKLHCPKPLISFVTENGERSSRKLSYSYVNRKQGAGHPRCRHPFSAHNTLHFRIGKSAPLNTSGYCWVSRSFDLPIFTLNVPLQVLR